MSAKGKEDETLDMTRFTLGGASNEDEEEQEESSEETKEEKPKESFKESSKETKTEAKKKNIYADEDEEEEDSSKDKSKQKETKAKVEEKEDEEEEEEEEEEEDSDLDFKPIIADIFEELGLDWDDKFLPKESNSIKGFAKIIEELIEDNSTPEYSSVLAQQFDEHLAKGGDPKKFMQLYVDKPDYSKFSIETLADQKLIVKEHLRRTSKLSDSKIEKFVDTLVIDKEIEAEAKDALKELQALDEDERKAEKIRLDKEEKAEQDRVKANITRINNLIDKGGVEELGFELDSKARKGFKSFLFDVDKTGETAYQKMQKKNPNLQFTLAYLAYAGIINEKALGLEAKTKITDNVKKQVLAYASKKNGSTKASDTKNTKVNVNEYDRFTLAGQ